MARAAAITPVLRYRDAGKAARWLCEAFGFHEHDRAQALDGGVRFVSLRFGDSFVVVRPVGNSGLDDLMVQPEAIGGASTQICYLTIPDAVDHRKRAEAAGAKIETEPQDDGLGGRFYTCRDLEDHLWSFGTRTYGVAQEVASAFEPAELSPSHASAAIAPPQGGGRTRGWQSRLFRDIGIAGASAVLVAGAWIYYATYAGSTLREAASTSAATAARLQDAVKELAHERSLRLAAEAASKETAATLAEERNAAAELQRAVQRAQTELAAMRKEKDRAVLTLKSSNGLLRSHRLARERAEAELAAAKAQIAEAEAKLAKLASDHASEDRARLAKQEQELLEAKTALLAANKMIEELRTRQLEPMVPDDSNPVAENAPCLLAVQGKVAFGLKGPTTWPPAGLSRLCRGAETSVEPGKCFEELMRGKVSWGAGTTWLPSNALALCGGTLNARRTLDCFKREVASSQSWQIAIRQCRTSK
jgi:uncharacterized glyoxalase superfamily protein PhnB